MKYTRRTGGERAANEFDQRLYALIHRARVNADTVVGAASRDRIDWMEIAAKLNGARAVVRGLMHKDDLEGTEG